MTYKQFLAALRKTPRTWRVIYGGLMRTPINCCPITAVDPLKLSPSLFALSAEAIGLSQSTAERIVYAADNSAPHDRRIRRDLLKACGLKERA